MLAFLTTRLVLALVGLQTRTPISWVIHYAIVPAPSDVFEPDRCTELGGRLLLMYQCFMVFNLCHFQQWNDASYCFQEISISYNGQSTKAQITDQVNAVSLHGKNLSEQGRRASLVSGLSVWWTRSYSKSLLLLRFNERRDHLW